VTRDITERKWTEEALQESEERLQAILIIQTACQKFQGQYILVNYVTKSFFHYQEEVKGKTDYDFFPKEMADVLRANDHI